MSRPSKDRIAALMAIAAGASASFAILTLIEREHLLAKSDRKALKKIAKRYGRYEDLAHAIHPAGKWWWYMPAAAAAACAVYANGSGGKRARAGAAEAILLAATISAIVNPFFDRTLPQPPLPPSRKSNPQPTFPSGHTFGLGAIAFAAAYVFEREGRIPRAIAVPLALVAPAIGGMPKMIEKKHWPSEVAGGFLVATAIAAASVIAYERHR